MAVSLAPPSKTAAPLGSLPLGIKYKYSEESVAPSAMSVALDVTSLFVVYNVEDLYSVPGVNSAVKLFAVKSFSLPL